MSVSHQVDDIKDDILESPPANISPTFKFVAGVIGELVTGSDVFETTTDGDETTTDGDTEEETGGEILKFSSLISEAGKTSIITDKKTTNMINVLVKLGYKVDEKDYIDLRRTTLDDDDEVLKNKSIQAFSKTAAMITLMRHPVVLVRAVIVKSNFPTQIHTDKPANLFRFISLIN